MTHPPELEMTGKNEDADRFDKHFRNILHGGTMDGRYHLESFHESDRPAMAGCLDHLQRYCNGLGHGSSGWTQPFRVHANYVNDARPDAFATQDSDRDDVYFIGITAGLALKGFGLWSTVCACTNLFAPHEEHEHSPPEWDVLEAFRQPEMMGGWHILPERRDRLVLAHCLDLIAKEWIFFHELAHVVHGHVGRRKMRDGPLNLIAELARVRQDRISFEDHLMEVDADQAATWWCLNQWVQGKSPLLSHTKVRLDRDDYAHLLFFVVCMLHHAFSPLDTLVEEVSLGEGQSHPHGEIRIDVAFNTIHQFYAHSGLVPDYNEEHLSTILGTAIREVDNAINTIAPGHTPFPNLLRDDKIGKPIKNAQRFYHDRLDGTVRSAWRPYRLNAEPDTLKELFAGETAVTDSQRLVLEDVELSDFITVVRKLLKKEGSPQTVRQCEWMLEYLMEHAQSDDVVRVHRPPQERSVVGLRVPNTRVTINVKIALLAAAAGWLDTHGTSGAVGIILGLTGTMKQAVAILSNDTGELCNYLTLSKAPQSGTWNVPAITAETTGKYCPYFDLKCTRRRGTRCAIDEHMVTTNVNAMAARAIVTVREETIQRLM
jgi:hypothetical protein